MTPKRRVVVGVAESPAGLRAVREAVELARLRRVELRAVRAFPPPAPDRYALRDITVAAGRPLAPEPAAWAEATDTALRARERAALQTIDHAFAAAMGGLPDDVDVRPLAVLGDPGAALTGAAHLDGDLLILGTAAPRWFRSRRHSVAGYCVRHATCPVLLVPPHDLARRVQSMHRPWHWRTLENLLADDARP